LHRRPQESFTVSVPEKAIIQYGTSTWVDFRHVHATVIKKWSNGVGGLTRHRLTVTEVVEEAVRAHLAGLAKRFNGGKPFSGENSDAAL
jgi:hypothetical protein